jgi:hypothetical protein
MKNIAATFYFLARYGNGRIVKQTIFIQDRTQKVELFKTKK